MDRGTFLLSSVLPAAAENNSPLSHRNVRKSSKISKNKNPLETLTVGGDEALMAGLELNVDEAPKMNVFGVENFSTPPSSPEKNVGKGNEDSVAAPAPEGKIGQSVIAAQREYLVKALLNGEELSKTELWSLTKENLYEFLRGKCITFKKNEKKDVLIARVLEARKDMVVQGGVTVDAELPKDEDSHEEQLKRDQILVDAAVFAIEEACAVTHVEAGGLVDAEELVQVLTPAGGQPTSEVPIFSAIANAHGLSHVQNIVQPARDDAPLNVDPPVHEGALGLVDVEVGSKTFFVLPEVKEHVDKVGAVVAKWTAESEELMEGFRHLNGDVETNRLIRSCFRQAALKLSKMFMGITAQPSAIDAAVSTAVQPSVLAPKDAVAAMPIVAAQVSKTARLSESAPKDAAAARLIVAAQGDVVTKDGTTGMPSGNVLAVTTTTSKLGGECEVSSSEQQRVADVVKSASNVGEWLHGVVKFGRGDKGDTNWRRGEITNGSGMDFVFVLRDAYSNLKRGDQVKFQVQDNLFLEEKMAINISRELGATTPPAVLSVPNGNDGAIGVPSAKASVITINVHPSGERKVSILKKQNATGVVKSVRGGVPPATTGEAALTKGVLHGCESMEGTVAYLSGDREYGFIRHLGRGSDFFFGTDAVQTSVGVGDKVKFQFDDSAMKKGQQRRKAFDVIVTHVRNARDDIDATMTGARDARDDINAAKAVREGCGQKDPNDLRRIIKPTSILVAAAPLVTVAKAVSDTGDVKTLEGLAGLLINFLIERFPPPPPTPTVPRN